MLQRICGNNVWSHARLNLFDQQVHISARFLLHCSICNFNMMLQTSCCPVSLFHYCKYQSYRPQSWLVPQLNHATDPIDSAPPPHREIPSIPPPEGNWQIYTFAHLILWGAWCHLTDNTYYQPLVSSICYRW